MKITVMTPTIRKSGVDLLTKCLVNQTFDMSQVEWIISTNRFDIWTQSAILPCETIMLNDPPKGNYFYALNRSWNNIFREARGELLISIVDLTWISPDCLERFWTHYQLNSKAIISGVGHQYDQIINNKPEHEIWHDPRARLDQGTFYEVGHLEIEWCCTSIPKRAVYDVGGLDEEFDKYAVVSEKEINFRMTKVGYKCYLDQNIEYRALWHPRLAKDEIWDKKYHESQEYYNKCVMEIIEGKRLKLNYVI